MITHKVFDSEKEMNNFIEENKIKVVSIETIKQKVNSGLPTMKGPFIYEADRLKLWFDNNK